MDKNESLKPGSILADGKFIIDKLIAKGGFSFIYEGRIIYQLALDNEFVSIKAEEKHVVIKELYISEKSRRESDGITLLWNDENEPDEEMRLSHRIKKKTRNEALKLRLLENPHILKIVGAIEENNTIYQITEKIEDAIDFHKWQGLSIEKMGVKLSVSDAVKYITQISEALKEVHGKNIVHLDIKPENILRDNKDNAILIDFGISMTIGEKSGGSTILSAASRPWAPPEQYNIKDTIAISFASDIYSLGQTFYAFLTGVIPPDFSEVTSGSVILLPPSQYNKDVTDYLDEIVIKCIQSKRDKRYQTIEEFLFALQGEKDYKNIIDQTREAEQKGNYEEAIHLLNESEKYIPLSSDLLELRFEYQHKLKQKQKEGEYKQNEQEAQKLMHHGDFEKALSILELLPFNKHIGQQIEKCKHGISLKRKTELIAEAENLIGRKQYENALNKYQEAKVIDQSDVAIDRSIEELQKILQDIEKNKKYNEFIVIGDKAFKGNELEKALEAYKLAKDNVTLSSFTIDKKIETCVQAISERDERERAKKATAEALDKIKDNPLSEIAEEQLATEINQNVDKQRLIEEFREEYAWSDAFQTEFLATQARTKELEQLRLYFKAETEKSKRAYDVALKILADITSSTLKERVVSLQKEIKNAQETAKIEALEKEIKELIKQNNFEIAEMKLLEVRETDKLLFENLQTMLDHQKLTYAASLSDKGNYDDALSLLQMISSKSSSFDVAQTALATIILQKAQDAINKKNYQAATTLLNDIPNNSTIYEQATQLFDTIDKEQFDNAKRWFDKQDSEKALGAFRAIGSHSAYYKEAQNYIHILELQIEVQCHQALLSEAQHKVDAKKYKEARRILARIPAQSTVDGAKADLLQCIANEGKSKKKTVWITLISVIAIFALIWGLTLLSRSEEVPEPVVIEEPLPDISVSNEEKKHNNQAIASEQAQREREAAAERKKQEQAAAAAEKAKREREAKRKAEEERVQKESKAQALTLVREADELFVKGLYDLACDKYVQANRLSPGTGNVGATKFDALVQQLSFDKDAPAYKNNLRRANRIRNTR